MKKTLLATTFSALVLGIAANMGAEHASAHGFVETPAARGYMGSLEKNTLGWNVALEKYGKVITNPQSLECKKGFPQEGPADTHIASAEGGFGQIGDFVLDEQTSTRWNKTDIATGTNTFTWKYTAPHRTSKWHYYMTKPNWNQNAPLTRDELELIGVVNHDGTTATNNLSHQIKIPENRMGYHVILAVWDVADTANAFYNVIDVNVKNNSGVLPVMPNKPTGLQTTHVSSSTADLEWNAQMDAVSYNVYRDGKKIATVSAPEFHDKGLKAGTKYSYQVEAVSDKGMVSEKSAALSVTTDKDATIEKPTTPRGLHSMGTTENSVNLMWAKSTHSKGIKSYKVFRNGVEVAEVKGNMFMDKGLSAETTYSYVVQAVSVDDNLSEKSAVFTVKTKASEVTGGGVVDTTREWKVGTFNKPELYTVGETVKYNGKHYTVRLTHYNYGDGEWNPEEAVALFSGK